MPDFTTTIEGIAAGFEVVGVGIILVGFVLAALNSVRIWSRSGGGAAYLVIRSTFGRSILLGLEVLVAGDIIRTVALQPTLTNLAVLGLLVLIRTFLAWSMEVEIDGYWPWKRSQVEKERAVRPAEVASK